MKRAHYFINGPSLRDQRDTLVPVIGSGWTVTSGKRFASSEQLAQCVAAFRPFSRPASASKNAPVQTEPVLRALRDPPRTHLTRLASARLPSRAVISWQIKHSVGVIWLCAVDACAGRSNSGQISHFINSRGAIVRDVGTPPGAPTPQTHTSCRTHSVGCLGRTR